MPWDKSFVETGVVKFDEKYVYVHYNPYGGATSIYTGYKVLGAQWVGGEVVITTDKCVFKYHDPYKYTSY